MATGVGALTVRHHLAMLDDADSDATEVAPLDAERVYREYLETCRRRGVEPVSRE
jgi:hypothetical protein